MKRVLAALLLFLCLLPMAQAQPFGAGTIETLARPLAGYTDDIIVQVAAAAADPRLIDSLPDPALRTYVLEHPDWATQLASAYAMQQIEFWQAIDALRGGPVAGIVPIPVPAYAPVIAYAPLAPVVASSYYIPPAPRVVSTRPVVTQGFFHTGQPAVPRNGAPSAAQQMQNANSAAYLQRQRAASQPSAASRIQQGQAFTSNSLAPGFTPYRPIPEAARRPIVQQHYPQHWQKRSPP